MKELHTEIEINATPETVWHILMDFDSYPEWNPFILRLSGTAAIGETLQARLRPEGGKPVTVRPKVTELEPFRSFEWLGRLGVKGLFDGRHRFRIEPTSGGTRLVQNEEFTGFLVPLLSRSLNRGTRRGFVAMNEALKERAEGKSARRG